ncbi:MAG: serine protease [Pseudomonadota bacterium]
MRVLLAVLSVAVLLAGAARAQQDSFVQIEAHPTLREGQDRARAYANLLPNINGFTLRNGWFALALGPYDASGARQALRALRTEGLIPRDSYLTRAGDYRDRFWPSAGPILVPPATTGVVASPNVAVTPLPDATEPAGVEAVTTAPPLIQRDPETPQAARRSERLLTRIEREDLQTALQWFGFYNAAIDGSFGRGTRNAMAAWQAAQNVEPTGILTTLQRQRLMDGYREAQAALGLAPLRMTEAGVGLTAPMALVRFDRVEAPFVHYAPAGDSGVRMALISQSGDEAGLAALYDILQTLEAVPRDGPRERRRDGFDITGVSRERTTQVVAKLDRGHIVGFLLSWPERQDEVAARAVPEMTRTLASIGPALSPEAGFDAAAQSTDMMSGLALRRPIRAASGFFVAEDGAVLTAAETVAGCGRITLDDRHEALVSLSRDGAAVLRPAERLAPLEVAALSSVPARLRSPVTVSGYSYGGVLTDATLSRGILADLQGLNGEADRLRLQVTAQPGDAVVLCWTSRARWRAWCCRAVTARGSCPATRRWLPRPMV